MKTTTLNLPKKIEPRYESSSFSEKELGYCEGYNQAIDDVDMNQEMPLVSADWDKEVKDFLKELKPIGGSDHIKLNCRDEQIGVVYSITLEEILTKFAHSHIATLNRK